MKQLVDAIVQRYNKGTTPECVALRVQCRAFYPRRMPQHPDWPCVMADVDTPSTTDHVMQATGPTGLYEGGQVKLTIFVADTTDEGAERAEVVYQLVTAAFDNADLTMANYRTVSLLRQGQHLLPDPDGGWLYHVLYKFYIGRK